MGYDNLLIEDVIGPGSNCKYKNLKEYLIHRQNKVTDNAKKMHVELTEKIDKDVGDLNQLMLHKMIQQKVDYSMILKKLKNEITDLTAKIEYNSKAGF